MLRRAPTSITITAEDIAAYEDMRAREVAEAKVQRELARQQAEAQLRQQGMGTPDQNRRPNEELRPPPVEKRGLRSREERLGLTGRS